MLAVFEGHMLELFKFVTVVGDLVEVGRGAGESLKDLAGKSSHDGPVGTVEFGPAFFKDDDPDLPSCGWFGKQRVPLLVDWDVVINNNFLQHSLVQYSNHIDPMFADLQLREEVLDAGVLFCQG